jgi:hypothetical protein
MYFRSWRAITDLSVPFRFFSGVIGRSIKNNNTIIGKVLTCNNPKVNSTGNFTDAERRKNVDGLTSKRQLLAPAHCQIQFVILKDVVCWIFAQHMLYTRGVVVVFFASRSHSKRGRLHVFVTCSISLWWIRLKKNYIRKTKHTFQGNCMFGWLAAA